MKKLDSKLFKFKKQKVDDLSKIIGGEQVSTTWNLNDGECIDKAETDTTTVWVMIPGLDRCIQADPIQTGSPIVYN